MSRVAIVTGAARGIGAATAVKLASDGAAVAVLDLSSDACAPLVDQIRSAGGTAVAFSCDVADEAQVDAVFDKVAGELGSVDVLVNNAGVLRDNLLHKMSSSDWDIVMNVHLRGAFLCSRAAQRHMVPQRSGKIVNTSSVSALATGGRPTTPPRRPGSRV